MRFHGSQQHAVSIWLFTKLYLLSVLDRSVLEQKTLLLLAGYIHTQDDNDKPNHTDTSRLLGARKVQIREKKKKRNLVV